MLDIHEVIHRKLICRKVSGEDLVAVVRNSEPHDPECEFIVWHRNVSASSSSPYSVSLRHIMVVVSCAVSHKYVIVTEQLRSVVDIYPPGVSSCDCSIKTSILIAEMPVP